MIALGIFRLKNDFKTNKKRNNIIGLILSGQASGIGQLISGVIVLIVACIVFFMTK